MKLKYLTTIVFMISILKTTAQSGYSLELNLRTIPTEQITKNETETNFSLNKKIDAKNTISNNLSYKNTRLNYNLDNYYSANNNNIYNRIENNLELVHQINSKINLDIEFKTVAAFEKNFDTTDLQILGGAGIKYWMNNNNSLHIGIKRMTVFGKAEVLPTIAFYSKINTKTAMELGFPKSSISYSNNERNVFQITNSFDGEYYNLDKTKAISPNLYATKMRFSQMRTALVYERNMDKNWYMSFQAGYELNKKYNLTNDRGTVKFNFDANDGYLFNIGIKYKQ